jgi:hypothetical protein
MNRTAVSVFILITCSTATSWLGFSNQMVQAQVTKVALGVPQIERRSNQLLTPDELFEQQQREQELLQNQWQRQQDQWQQQQQDRWQQQFDQQQLQQQLLIQQQQQRQLQQFNQPKP